MPCRDRFRTIPLEDRFFSYVGRKQPNGCILWTGTTNRDGYGIIGSGTKKGRNILAHRLSYELMVGPIPDDLCALHRCDNPPCINPLHLFLGDSAANAADRVAKGRTACGSQQWLAKLTDDKVRAIRHRYSQGGITQRTLAEEYGVYQTVVGKIIRREIWKHVQ